MGKETTTRSKSSWLWVWTEVKLLQETLNSKHRAAVNPLLPPQSQKSSKISTYIDLGCVDHVQMLRRSTTYSPEAAPQISKLSEITTSPGTPNSSVTTLKQLADFS